ncbi:helix-turn-helix domain-containing protein [Phytomonospora endophytica]|uniref:Transcriptional regulator with XRE-family HTH domain n=1 Tax=Phytomonospora endophytica TaxID=714109 RepID=A0A841FWE0_9ACTN|nr:helix-turn-helix transcriptional regulator [Phytomonospora endophytica]MBB6037647.1 transcriptional regulator with XRE-family HTH domain [Phytomonospora endophytica]GIG67826.1 transcriptional regulator [Phytomonospora endophytica]
MAPRSDPSAIRWLIGTEIARIRKQAALSLADIAKATGISKPKVGNMETGRFQQFPDDIALVLEVCRADRRDIDRIVGLAAQQDAKTWWAAWSNVVPDWWKTFAGLEGLADAAFTFQPLLVPGLLQTTDYARAITVDTGFVRPDQTERFVSFRQARASRLTAEEPLTYHVVIGEPALRLAVGTVEQRRAQFEHVLELGRRNNVTIQILRPEDGAHPALAIGEFSVLDFSRAQSIAFSEMFDGAVYVQDADSIETYKMVAENLRQVAQSPAASVKTIKGFLEALS